MSNNYVTNSGQDQAPIYQIRIKGHLSCQWTEWFEGLAITLADNGDTLLTGSVVDQAALHGLLRKVRDLGAPLISVNCVRPYAEGSAPEQDQGQGQGQEQAGGTL